MDARIVRDFENLRVFTRRLQSVNMDDLVQDLSFALDDASSITRARSTDSLPALMNQALKRSHKKRRSTKRRSVPPGPDSEASESSIEEALKDYMENVTVRSDSDDCPRTARMPALVHQNVISLVESDSLTENFSPLRPLRRRRKFKRMAVDACPADEFAIPSTRTLRPKKSKTRPRSDDDTANTDTRMETDVGSTNTGTLTRIGGKRKRSYRQTGGDQTETDTYTEDMSPQSGSALSSSEDDRASSTQDESREADDEQSDFFHESGPACGIPGIIPWWECPDSLNDNDDDDSITTDPEFQKILTGSLRHLSAKAERGFKARLSRFADSNGREIRYGRRRLNDKMPRYSMARYMQDRQKWREASGPVKLRPVWPANPQATMETKRRRKTPPTSSNEVTTPEPDAAPIPECNIGNQMLQMMGWTVGSGLGPTGAGIKVPLQATIRPKRQGLGYDMDDDDS